MNIIGARPRPAICGRRHGGGGASDLHRASHRRMEIFGMGRRFAAHGPVSLRRMARRHAGRDDIDRPPPADHFPDLQSRRDSSKSRCHYQNKNTILLRDGVDRMIRLGKTSRMALALIRRVCARARRAPSLASVGAALRMTAGGPGPGKASRREERIGAVAGPVTLGPAQKITR